MNLEVEYVGSTTDPWDNEPAVFSARGRIDREDWGLTWNMLLEAGGLVVSKEISIEIEVELSSSDLTHGVISTLATSAARLAPSDGGPCAAPANSSAA